MEKIVLASGSPRRKELLARTGVDFSVVVSNGEEKTNLTDPVPFAAFKTSFVILFSAIVKIYSHLFPGRSTPYVSAVCIMPEKMCSKFPLNISTRIISNFRIILIFLQCTDSFLIISLSEKHTFGGICPQFVPGQHNCQCPASSRTVFEILTISAFSVVLPDFVHSRTYLTQILAGT